MLGDMNRMGLALDRVQMLALVLTVLNCQIPRNWRGNFLVYSLTPYHLLRLFIGIIK